MNEPFLRPARLQDAAELAAIIRTVMPEFGASGPGFAINDPEVNDLPAAYSRPRCAYFVVEWNGEVVGGGGVAPLEGADESTCELRKMYFLPRVRGRGIGRKMLERCLAAAKEIGFTRCYLETLKGMTAAKKLYESFGFKPLCTPKGKTGHFGCDTWYEKVIA